MIIEFFGPPCGGKTTLAAALSRRLEEDHYHAHLISSYRPAEVAGKAAEPPDRIGAAVHRIARAIAETGALVRKRACSPDGTNVAAALLRLMPPSGVGRSARMSQYLSRLAHNWQIASKSDQITIFDQAFVQAIFSLAQFRRRLGAQQLDDALSLIPMPDLLISLHIPIETLSARLSERQQNQGRLERLLEIPPAKNLASVEIFNALDERLRKRRIRLIKIANSGSCHVDSIVQDLVETIQTGMQRKLVPVVG